MREAIEGRQATTTRPRLRAAASWMSLTAVSNCRSRWRAVGRKLDAEARQLDVPRRAVKQRAADLVFELVDGLGKRRLRKRKGLRRGDKASLVRDGDERAQMLQGDIIPRHETIV